MKFSEKRSIPPRILLVDDEKSTRLVIGRSLQLCGYQVNDAADGRQALQALEKYPYDVLLLDLNMPELNGSQVMDIVREKYPDLQVIILTAHASLESAIAAVKTGAVDYLLKPQSINQIKAAVEKALKRSFDKNQHLQLVNIIGDALDTLQTNLNLPAQAPGEKTETNANNPVEMNGMLFDPERRRLITYTEPDGQKNTTPRTSELTAHQCAILSFMVENPQKVFSNLEIARQALGYHNLSDLEADRIIRPHILKLRRKIEADPSNPCLIRSVRGKGYLFSPP